MNLAPQPGDTWTLDGKPSIEVVAVKQGDVYYTFAGKPMRDPEDRFIELAGRSLARGAVLHRGGKEWRQEDEEFEV